MWVRVLGAGIIGLSCADELQRRGHRVTVVDPAPGSGASYAAAGMLSPSSEVWYGEPSVLGLGLRSLELWPALAARLDVPLHRAGTLLVGLDRGDLQEVERQASLLEQHGVGVGLLDRHRLRALEPSLSSRVVGGLLLPHDHSVDPRAVMASLRARVPVVGPGPVVEVETTFDATVVATGAVLPEPYAHLVRGVRGEIVRAHLADPPTHTVRGWAHGRPVYVVPRPTGELVIGATVEEHDEPPVATVGGVAQLLDAARELVPGLDRAVFVEAIARDRPGTADNLPLVGPVGPVGPAGPPGPPGPVGPVGPVVLAAGHFRHGVLLAPLTARLVADHLETGHVERCLDPRRFGPLPERTVHAHHAQR